MISGEVYVTGFGVVSAAGIGVGATAGSLVSGRSGVSFPRFLDTVHRDIPVGEVGMSNSEIARLLGMDLSVSFATRASLLGMLAMDEALEMASLKSADKSHIFLVSATTVGGMDETEHFYPDGREKTSKGILYHDCGTATDVMASRYGRFAMQTTISTACSAALNAILCGCRLIRSGRADIVVAGGTECLSRYHLNGFNSLMILDRERCRPFDRNRAGLNLGEGAGYLVLESGKSASRRGVRKYAAVTGYANRCDCYHQTASSPEGNGAFLVMSDALASASLKPGDIDYINAHGTGTVNNDLSEGRAVERLFGNVPDISSTKAFTGHTTSASGGVESVISLIAMQERFRPVSLGFSEKMDELSFAPVCDMKRGLSLNRVMVNAFGFGGNDTCVIFED